MLRFQANVFVRLLDQIGQLEYRAQATVNLTPVGADSRSEVAKQLESIIKPAITACERLRLECSRMQAERILTEWKGGCSVEVLRRNIQELAQRVRDELATCVFYCIHPSNLAFFERDKKGRLELRSIEDVFGESVVRRFGMAISGDLSEALQCYVFMRSAACVFHLLRAVEIGIPKLAKLCDMKDPKPSWGTVLERAEKLTQQTKYDDLPETLKPHVEFLRRIVADMRSMQRAWRNKVSHVEDRLTVAEPDFNPQVTYNIFVAASSFLLELAEGLPEGY